MKKLTDKQKSFVDEYMIDKNATQAAIRAGYSLKTAKQMGTENLAKPILREAIDKGLKKLSDAALMSAEDVIRRLSEEANADLADLIDEQGAIKEIKEWPKVFRTGLISGIDVYTEKFNGVKIGETVKLKQSERIKRLELLGRHYGLFTDNVHSTGTVTNHHVFPATVSEHEFEKNMEIVDE